MNYRKDIDGLRAIAVIPVILFHFGLQGISGGYVGVDIFFCISGYLIGGIIIDETSSGKFSYAQFYERRIKRLFPAFFVVAIATIPLAFWLLLPNPDFRVYGKSLFASTIYLPNIVFYRELGGYFAHNAATKPLLHTWSLGVEEQFYILFPLIMRFAVRGKSAYTFAILATLAAVSLFWSQYLLAVDPVASFFLLPSRAWELLLGAMVALPSVKSIEINKKAGSFVSALAILAIALPMFFYSEKTLFPGIAALPPCLGTAWLLWRGNHAKDDLAQNILSSTILVWIGRISYSLYLWHWPVYVFVAYYFSGELSLSIYAAALVLIFLLSIVSWRFIEQPVRSLKSSPNRIFSYAAVGSILIAGVGLLIWRTDGMPNRLSGQIGLVAGAADDFIQSGGTCLDADNTSMPGLEYCRIGVQKDDPQFLIWGDSHGRAMRDGADQLATELGRSGLLIWSGGCMPAFDYAKRETAAGPQADKDCVVRNAHVRALLEKPSSVKKVLLIGRWSYYAEGEGIGIDRHNKISVTSESQNSQTTGADAASADQELVVEKILLDTVHWLRDHGYDVYILEQVPEFPQFSGVRLFQLVRSGRETFPDALKSIGEISTSQLDMRQKVSYRVFEKASAEMNAKIIRTHQLFCKEEMCNAMLPSGQAYFDNNHLTVTASKDIRQVLTPAMTP